jgi:hypothetical protein
MHIAQAFQVASPSAANWCTNLLQAQLIVPAMINLILLHVF